MLVIYCFLKLNKFNVVLFKHNKNGIDKIGLYSFIYIEEHYVFALFVESKKRQTRFVCLVTRFVVIYL